MQVSPDAPGYRLSFVDSSTLMNYIFLKWHPITKKLLTPTASRLAKALTRHWVKNTAPTFHLFTFLPVHSFLFLFFGWIYIKVKKQCSKHKLASQPLASHTGFRYGEWLVPHSAVRTWVQDMLCIIWIFGRLWGSAALILPALTLPATLPVSNL